MPQTEDSHAEATDLFDRYVKALDGEFRDRATLDPRIIECYQLATQLLRLGYQIMVRMWASTDIRNEDGEKKTVVVQTRELFLFALPLGNNQDPIATATATSVIFGSHAAPPKKPELPSDRVMKEDIDWLRENNIAWEIPDSTHPLEDEKGSRTNE